MFNQIFGRRGNNATVVPTHINRYSRTGALLPFSTEVVFTRYDPSLNSIEALDLLQRNLYDVVRETLAKQRLIIRRSNPRANPVFHGRVYLENTDSGRAYSVKAVTLDSFASRNFFNQALDKIIQSNSNWTPMDMKIVWIYNRTEFIGGSAPAGPCPSYIKKIFWKTYDHFGELPCAAFSIAYYLTYYPFGVHPHDRNSRVTKEVLRKAREITNEMGWCEFVSLEEIKEFVVKYPQYRLTVLNDRIGSNDYSSMTWEGAEFDSNSIDPDSYQPCKNTIYIHLVGEVDHYVPILHPGTHTRSRTTNRTDWNFCQNCCTSYLRKSLHRCANRQKSKVCPYKCGRLHEKISDCEFTRCKKCSRDRVRDYDGSIHRCLPRETKKPVEFDETDTNDGKKYQLYVWDIESCLEVQTSEKEYPVFEINQETGEFLGSVSVTVHEIRKHIPILVCVQNVFTGQKEKFYGQDCLQRLLDMAITRNKGKNIFIAHNSSGYDSLLLIEECYKRRGLDLGKQIFRGNKLIR